MIEKIVLDHLVTQLNMTDVYMEVPDAPPKKFIVIEKTGSGRVNLINSATIAVQSYDETLQKAAELNELVKTAMDDLVSNANIGKVALETDYNFTDTTTKRYRYQAVFDITHY